MTKTFLRLAPDGSYSDPRRGTKICAYSEEGMQGKQRFAKEAQALLRETGKHLSRMDLTQCKVMYNPGGVAVSGEVMAHISGDENHNKRVFVWIEGSCVTHEPRADGVRIYARTQQQLTPDRWVDAANQVISPMMDSRQLAITVYEIYEREYALVRVHTLSAAPIIIEAETGTNPARVAAHNAYLKSIGALRQDSTAIGSPASG